MARPSGEPPRLSAAAGAPVSLKANVLANAVSQIYLVLAAVLTMPFFLRRMGAEAYGLIGFFTLMTAWFQILDAGLSLTLSRESARFRAGAIDAPTLRALTLTLEVFFFAVASVGALAVAASAHLIAVSWLKVQRLPTEEVAGVVLLMGLTAPLQWVTGLYRGAINGFERQVWLSGFNIAMATLRFGGAAVAVTLLPATPWTFFGFQLGVSVVELAVLIVMGRRVLPHVDSHHRRALRPSEVRDLLGFSASLAFAVAVWVLVTQIDKLVLSRILSLSSYGVYSLAVLAAGGVLALGAPIAQALLPRLAKLATERAEEAVVKLYREATQVVCLITIPCALTLAFFAGPTIWAWTGDAKLVLSAGPILTAYALGNGVLTVAAFPYYLQYARGDLRLHVIGNVILVGALAPIIALAASRFGAVGAGYAWFGVNAVYLLAWVPWVHRRLVKGLHGRWLMRDVGPIVLVTTLAAWALSLLIVWPRDRLSTAIGLALSGAALTTAAALASSVARGWLWATVQRFSRRAGIHPA